MEFIDDDGQVKLVVLKISYHCAVVAIRRPDYQKHEVMLDGEVDGGLSDHSELRLRGSIAILATLAYRESIDPSW